LQGLAKIHAPYGWLTRTRRPAPSAEAAGGAGSGARTEVSRAGTVSWSSGGVEVAR
jgi:hypothetical protein